MSNLACMFIFDLFLCRYCCGWSCGSKMRRHSPFVEVLFFFFSGDQAAFYTASSSLVFSPLRDAAVYTTSCFSHSQHAGRCDRGTARWAVCSAICAFSKRWFKPPQRNVRSCCGVFFQPLRQRFVITPCWRFFPLSATSARSRAAARRAAAAVTGR